MAKEIKAYEAIDGKIFKTQNGADNHNKKLTIDKIKQELQMSDKEITEKLQEIAKNATSIEKMFKLESDWRKWPVQIIKTIGQVIKKNQLTPKKTIYVKENKSTWGKNKEEILFTEEAEEFTSIHLHCENLEEPEESYVFVKEVLKNEFFKKVYYDYKYDWRKRMAMKLENNKKLTSNDIGDLVWNFDEVYREEGENRRWSKSILSVLKIEDKLYAVDWEQGLTENQENEFYNQPYPVKIETKEVVITKTIIVPLLSLCKQ